MVASQRVSNRKFRDASGWAPAYPDARVGLGGGRRGPRGGLTPCARSGRGSGSRTSRSGFALVGFWAAFAPRSFYTDFPGAGRHWISPDGPYNQHLIRDVGELNLALLVVVVAAAVTLSLPLVRAALVATLVNGVLHVVYHVRARRHVLVRATRSAIIGSLVLAPVDRPGAARDRAGAGSEPAPRRDRSSGVRRVAACRGWPCSGGPAACASWSSCSRLILRGEAGDVSRAADGRAGRGQRSRARREERACGPTATP